MAQKGPIQFRNESVRQGLLKRKQLSESIGVLASTYLEQYLWLLKTTQLELRKVFPRDEVLYIVNHCDLEDMEMVPDDPAALWFFIEFPDEIAKKLERLNSSESLAMVDLIRQLKAKESAK